MKKVSLVFSKVKKVIVLFPLIILTSFTQEHLIYLKNINKASIISLEQILSESGLSIKKKEGPKKKPDKEITNNAVYENPSKKRISEVSKQLQIPENQDFSINLSQENSFIILKSVQGSAKYLSDKSNKDKGIFLFHNGNSDSKIQFQSYDTGGALDKNIYYYIKAQLVLTQAVKPVLTTNLMTNNIQPSNQTIEAASSNTSAFSPMVDASISGLSPTEAVQELKKMLDSQDVSNNDKETIRYKIVDILIEQRSYTAAQDNVNQIGSAVKKSLYQARLQRARKNYKDSLRNYLNAISGDNETKKASILELESLILEMGTVEKTMIETLLAGTKALANDKRFYGDSMISIARIYQYIPDVYSAKDIFDSIINGDFDSDIKAKAGKYYDELKSDFLEYK